MERKARVINWTPQDLGFSTFGRKGKISQTRVQDPLSATLDAIKVNCDNYPWLSEECGGEKQEQGEGGAAGGGKGGER